MKKIVALLFLFSTVESLAQKGLDEMIATEKSFAAWSVANNTKEAFLKFMDTGAVMFDNGNPVNGYRLWQAKKPLGGILNWRPLFAEVGTSGDFGYTCGPWTFQPKAVTDSITESGYFFTVWQKKGGDWKFIYDGGTGEGPKPEETDVIKISSPKMRGSAQAMLDAEKSFTEIMATDKALAYKKFLAQASILCRNGSGLAVAPDDQKSFTASLPAGLIYQFLGSGITRSSDLGYTYGNTYLNGRKDFYFHVWRREKEGWKLAVEMVRYRP